MAKSILWKSVSEYKQVHHTAVVFTPQCPTDASRDFKQNNSETGSIPVEQTAYNLFPVPNNGNFKLQGDLQEGDRIQVLNLDGQLVFEEILQQDSLSALVNTQLSSGTYVIQVKKRDAVVFRSKIVVIK